MVQLLGDVTASCYFTMMFDLSSDISNEEHLLLYIRYFQPGSMLSVTRFLCCVRVVSKTGEVLAHTILTICDTLGLDYTNKCVGVCTDGDTAMTGRERGCIAYLQSKCKYLKLTLHCAAHVTNLVMVNTQKHSSVLQCLDTVFTKVHSLFNRRTGKYRLWQKHCSRHNIQQFAFPAFNTTRWFSRAQCAFALCTKLHVLLAFLSAFNVATNQPHHWGDGVAVMHMLLDFQFVFVLFALCDMLAPLERLRKELERDSGRVSTIPLLVEACVTEITQ